MHGVPCQDVDRSALAVDVERLLRKHLPAPGDHGGRDELDDLGVRSIDQPIQLAAPPTDGQHRLDLEHVTDAAEARDGHALEQAALDA